MQNQGDPYTARLLAVTAIVVVVADEFRLEVDVDSLPLGLQLLQLRPVYVVDAVHRAGQDRVADLSRQGGEWSRDRVYHHKVHFDEVTELVEEHTSAGEGLGGSSPASNHFVLQEIPSPNPSRKARERERENLPQESAS